MTVHTRALSRITLTVALLGASLVVVLLAAPGAVAVTVPRALNDTRPVTTGAVHVGFAIEHFGLVADLRPGARHLPTRGRTPYGEARFRVNGHWTPWQALEQDGAQEPGRFTAALIRVDRAREYQVRGLPAGGHDWEAAAINTTDGSDVVVAHQPRADAAAAAAGCLSRADWGADESITGWAHGDVQTYSPVQALTVHHTAGSNDPGQDYSATVRAIHSYHVQSNGWSDIGYQYLVDGAGRVYEGRSAGHTSKSCVSGGGDGSDFAHETTSDQVVTGAHVSGNNSGNLGVAVMGCFEATSECSGNTTPPEAAVTGLTRLLGSLADRHDLDPRGTTRYVNPVSGAARDVPVISGHRDWQSTACPGNELYTRLPAIRAAAGGSSPPPPPAAITSASCSGRKCTFAGTGVPVLRWRFGNGTRATGSPVTATYTARGSYPVRLTDSQSPATSATRTVTCRRVNGTLRCVS